MIAPHVGRFSRPGDLFLMGLFSIIDGIFDRSIRDVLDDIPLEHDLKAALLGETGRPKTVLNLVIAQEMGL